jgi:prephenate dehydrogenase
MRFAALPWLPERRGYWVSVFERIAIVGVGLIGGSFGHALKQAGFTGEIIGVSSPSTIATAVDRHAIDRGATLAEAAAIADLIYLAQPIGRILQVLRELDSFVRPDTLVTDAGSTKEVIFEAARTYLTRCQFLGGHPLAGKESRGVENAGADLFRGAAYILTPSGPDDLETAAASEFRSWIAKIGAREVVLGAEEHDQMIAFSSHLPQLAATALGSVLTDIDVVAGPGLAGSLRLAMSPYEIWRDILLTNREAIETALSAYIQKLEFIRENLRTRAVEGEFRAAAEAALRITKQLS